MNVLRFWNEDGTEHQYTIVDPVTPSRPDVFPLVFHRHQEFSIPTVASSVPALREKLRQMMGACDEVLTNKDRLLILEPARVLPARLRS